MQRRYRRGMAAAGIGLLASLSCGGPPLFLCHEDSECEEGGEMGTCQPGGLCSFPDPDCTTGQKYGSHAGTVSGECVPNVSDTGTTTGVASTSGAGSASTGDPGGDTTLALDDSSTGAPPSSSTSSSTGAASESSSGDGMPPDGGLYGLCDNDMECPVDSKCEFAGGGMLGLCLPTCVDPGMRGMCPMHPDGYPVECGAVIGYDFCYVPCADMAVCPMGQECSALMGNPDGMCVPP